MNVKRSFISKRYHLLANERSAVATHDQAAQFTVVPWMISTFIGRTTDLVKTANMLAYIEEKQTQGNKKKSIRCVILLKFR